jgi:Holliday junction resolvase
MAATPEAKVKAKIHKLLKEAGAYAVNYIGGQYANSGTPDILACLKGQFIGIEAKAGKNKPTVLQISNLRKIREAGGMALVINETNLVYLEESLNDPKPERSNYCFFESPQSAND